MRGRGRISGERWIHQCVGKGRRHGHHQIVFSKSKPEIYCHSEQIEIKEHLPTPTTQWVSASQYQSITWNKASTERLVHVSIVFCHLFCLQVNTISPRKFQAQLWLQLEEELHGPSHLPENRKKRKEKKKTASQRSNYHFHTLTNASSSFWDLMKSWPRRWRQVAFSEIRQCSMINGEASVQTEWAGSRKGDDLRDFQAPIENPLAWQERKRQWGRAPKI